MLRRAKRCISFLIILVFSLSYVITSLCVKYFEDELSLPELWYTTVDFFTADDVSCYEKETNDNFLIDIEEKIYHPNSIFFHETSCRRNLALRQACAVESVARSNPNRQVVVLFTKSLAEKECYLGPLGEVFKLPNVDFSKVNLKKYAVKTPLESVFRRNLYVGKRYYRRVAEYLKFITLHRYGGMVLDLDMMVVAPLDFLGQHFVVKQDANTLGSAIISIAKDKKHEELTLWFLSALAKQHQMDEIDGGLALYQVLEYACNSSDLAEMTLKKCGVRIYSEDLFYSVNHSSWRDLFQPGDLDNLSFGYHIWNSENQRLAVPRNSLYAKIARTFCPSVFNRFIYAFVDY